MSASSGLFLDRLAESSAKPNPLTAKIAIPGTRDVQRSQRRTYTERHRAALRTTESPNSTLTLTSTLEVRICFPKSFNDEGGRRVSDVRCQEKKETGSFRTLHKLFSRIAASLTRRGFIVPAFCGQFLMQAQHVKHLTPSATFLTVDRKLHQCFREQ